VRYSYDMSYAAVCIGVFIMIFAYFTLNAPEQGPVETSLKPQVTETTQFCQSASGDALTFTAPRDDNTKCPNGPSGSYKSGGVDPDNIFSAETTYKLIRTNVPLNRSFFTKEDGSDHSTLASDVGIEAGLDPDKYRLYFPQISGEINLGQAPYSRTRDCGDRSYENTGRMYFIDYGLAFGLVLKDGKPIEVSGTAIGGGSAVFWLTDVFKDVNREDEIPAEAFSCDSTSAVITSTVSGPQVNFPEQQRSSDSSQLQMEYFLFGQQNGAYQTIGNAVNGWVDSCKPAVYLYPPHKQLVNVKVYPSGSLTYTDPPYDNSRGWTVWANPDGKLKAISNQLSALSKNYDYLYYESKIKDEVIKKPTQGWVVKYGELNNLYRNILPKLGLNEKQQTDFIEYWDKALSKNRAPYYFVGVVDQENVNEIEKLEITPKPDSVNRVRIYFERLDFPNQVEAPILNTKFQIPDSRFKVVEWGGMVKNDKNHPFTCSQ
jgi:hypothetical protein